MTTRREFLGGVGAATVLAVVSSPALAVAASEDVGAPVTPLPAWEVGSGEWDWRVIFAETKKEAQAIWYVDTHGHEPDEPCECGCGAASAHCEKYGEGLPEARRTPRWDNPHNEEPTSDELFLAGWSTHCDRCSNEINREDGESAVVDHKCVCYDCMTEEELRIVSPDNWRFDEDEDANSEN